MPAPTADMGQMATPERPSKRPKTSDPGYLALLERVERIELNSSAPYDQQTEMNEFAHCEEQQCLRKLLRSMHVLLVDPLRKLKTPAVQKLLANAQELLTPPQEEHTWIITGPMGAGKSSTLNATFSKGVLAFLNDGGKSVTLFHN
ncbi:hypothetical protein B0A48_15466 [Cryoendolithus antarcticus]|uniref:G domain-containing protein n=1 Tax=Cryoendolithus antarcticus TaxID=1507870 RepID=A0A1V8SGU6_9PEZI|nr:hypothetical protein B0A48_15466 [Cryoendolithus antarcticus]